VTVTLEQVAKRYGWRRPWVVEDVDLELAESALTLLSGANGSGKTTVLRIIAGLTQPSAGVVRGRPRRVAVVPDRFVAPVRMTARAYLCHHGRLRGLTTVQAAKRAAELGERLGVVPGLGAAVQDLSKGNAQKIALAQAFLVPVDLLVLDEPRTGIDAQATAVLDELLDAATEFGTTVVLSDPAPGAGYPEAHRFQLAGGHLHPVDGGPAATDDQSQVTIRLRRRLPSAAGISGGPFASFAALAMRVSSDDGGLTLIVDPDRCDDVLRAALSDGWSVLDVQRRGRPRWPA
jgi:ABC-type Na+ transport system ATPase subunit NatA